ncbi:MucB/RseB C-terminal domain-containing protein [Methylophaga sp.]
MRGASHVGAINAFGTTMHAHFVTVVGEVPTVTVEKIGNAITHLAAQE